MCLFGMTELIGFSANKESLRARRFVLLAEYIGLYYYLVSMVYVSIVAGDLIEVVP